MCNPRTSWSGPHHSTKPTRHKQAQIHKQAKITQYKKCGFPVQGNPSRNRSHHLLISPLEWMTTLLAHEGGVQLAFHMRKNNKNDEEASSSLQPNWHHIHSRWQTGKRINCPADTPSSPRVGYFLAWWLKGSQGTMEIQVKCFDSSQGDDHVSNYLKMLGYETNGKSMCMPQKILELFSWGVWHLQEANHRRYMDILQQGPA